MRILSYARIGLATFIVGTGVFAGACSSSNPPSTVTTTTSSTSNANSSSGVQNTSSAGTTSGATTSPTGTGTSTSGTVPPSDAGAVGDANLCPSTLKDKMTTCMTGVDPTCFKGCGPDLPAGSAPPGNLGTKPCICQTGVYQCQTCNYETPTPGCYVPSATPATCPSTTVDKGACTTPCSGNGTGNDVCTITTDANKLEGCVCIMGSTGPIWTCATQWW